MKTGADTTQFQTDLTPANAAVDSLTYTLDDSNLLLDALRAKADSAQSVNEKLIRDVQDSINLCVSSAI